MTKTDFWKEIEAEFGEDVLTASADILNIIPTSSTALNISTGVGGVPCGRFTHIYGPDSSGKTTLGLDISKNVIKRGQKVLYIDVEQTLEGSLVRAILGDHRTDDNFVIVMPETAEDAFVIAERAIDSGEFRAIIFDSVGALAPTKEVEDEFGDSHYALVARLLTTFFKRNAFKVRTNNIAFIFLNQVRASIGSFIKTFEMPGGYALKHYSSLMILLFKSKKIEQKVEGKKEKEEIGHHVKFSVTKNKVGVPGRSSTYPLIWGEGIHYIRDAIDFAGSLGVITGRGPYKVFEDETIGLGIDKTAEALQENQELLDKIVKMCYDVVEIVPKPEIGGKEEDDGEANADN